VLTKHVRARGDATRNTTLIGVAFLVVLGMYAALTNASRATAQGQSSANLLWGKPADVAATDPATDAGGNATDWEIYNEVYETLVGVDDHLHPVPALATHWLQTSPRTYVFSIRKGVKFSNGRQMTVQDVVGSLKRVIDPKLASSWAGQLGIRSIGAAGPWKVRIVLTQPRTSFVPALSNIMTAILPMKELKAGTFDPTKSLLGTGPYKVVSHVQNQSWILVRNPYYWGTPGRSGRITIRIMTQDAARIAALRSGSVAVATFDTPDAVKLLKGQRNIKVVVENTTDYYRLDVNSIGSMFSDKRLRQALALSMNRGQITKLAVGGVGRPWAVATPNGLAGSCNPATVPFSHQDVAKAQALVQQAGASGKTVTILIANNLSTYAQIAQVLQSNLQAIGLKANIDTEDIGNVATQVYTGKPGTFQINVSYFAGYADPAMVLGWFNPNQAGWDKGFYQDDPQLDGLIAKASSTPAGPARNRFLQAACSRIATNANIIPVITKPQVIAYRSDKVVPRVPAIEGYSIPLRRIAMFRVK
jgi:peptide/nickel transport system substrate-binding protein